MLIVHVLLCLVADRDWLISPTSFRVTSLALGQSYDCPIANEVILKDVGKMYFLR